MSLYCDTSVLVFKETYDAFFAFPLVLYIYLLVHVKDRESKKKKKRFQCLLQQKLLSPTENTAPETPRQ